MTSLKLLSVLALAVIVAAQPAPEVPRFDLNRHLQCRACVLQGLQWCAKTSASDYDGSCIKITESCDAGTLATTKAESCPNDAPTSKHSCSLCVFDAYLWCQDKRFPQDEYAGRCVAAPNNSVPGQQHPPAPATPSTPQPPANGGEQQQPGQPQDSTPELDSAICGELAHLVVRPQGCATALNPDPFHPRRPDDDHDDDVDNDEDGQKDGQKRHWNWGKHSRGAMIAFGIFKVALIVTCLCCCCRKKCRQRCRERCHRWHHAHCQEHHQQQQARVGLDGSAVAVQNGCSFVGSEEQQVQQAMAASMATGPKPALASAPAPAPVNVMVNIPPAAMMAQHHHHQQMVQASADRKDANSVEMQQHYAPQGNAYPALTAGNTRGGYMPVQQHPGDI